MTSVVYQWQLLTKKEKGAGDGGKVKEEEKKKEESEEMLTESHGTHKPLCSRNTQFACNSMDFHEWCCFTCFHRFLEMANTLKCSVMTCLLCDGQLK